MIPILKQDGSNKFLIVSFNLSFWLVAMVCLGLVTATRSDFITVIYRTAINILFLLVLFYGNTLFLVNQFWAKQKYWSYVFLTSLFLLVIVGLRIQFNKLFPEVYTQPFPQEDMRVYVFTILTSLGVFLFSLFYQILINKTQVERQNMAIINEYNEAQIQFLKAQINPHFLFNSLNNIYSLSIEKSDRAPEMILKLSELLRYVLYNNNQIKVELENEVKHIYMFIDLFQMRFIEDKDIRFTVEGDLRGIQVEPMIIIPLVENCFKHCDFDSNEQAYIEMSLIIEDKQLVFRTNNTKDNLNLQKDKTEGIGLVNIQKRLTLNYPQGHQLAFKNITNRFEVNLKLVL
ncbi:MAG: sensor histidine kinase [Aureispira sp.]